MNDKQEQKPESAERHKSLYERQHDEWRKVELRVGPIGNGFIVKTGSGWFAFPGLAETLAYVKAQLELADKAR